MYKARYITQKENARIISEFCKPILKYKDAVKNWRRLADALRRLDKNEDIDEIYYKLRHWLGTRILRKMLVRNAGKTVFDLLNKNRYIKEFKIKMMKYIERTDIMWRKTMLREYFDRWRKNVKKMKQRENALNNMMELLDKYNLKNDANTLADAFLIKNSYMIIL
jgi:hypothetical protein